MKTILNVLVWILITLIGVLAYRVASRTYPLPPQRGLIIWRSVSCPAWYWFTKCKLFDKAFPAHYDDAEAKTE